MLFLRRWSKPYASSELYLSMGQGFTVTAYHGICDFGDLKNRHEIKRRCSNHHKLYHDVDT